MIYKIVKNRKFDVKSSISNSKGDKVLYNSIMFSISYEYFIILKKYLFGVRQSLVILLI